MPTYVIETTINPGVKYEVNQAEYEQLRDLGLLLNNNPEPLAGVFDREVSALVQDVNSQTYLRLTQLPLQPHTHLATEIADSGSVGRALLRTTSALDARTAIGALASTSVGAANGVAQLDASGKVPMSQLLTAANGVATLDSGGKIPQSQLPAIALQEFLGTVASQAAMLALTGQRGDWTTRTDLGTDWQLIAEPSTTLANWRERTYPASPVQSVDGKVGAVTLGAVAATGNELARRGSSGTLLVATATQAGEATTLAQTQALDTTAVATATLQGRQLPVSRTVSASASLAITDAGSIVNVSHSAAAPITVTVPAESAVNFPVGSCVELRVTGVGMVAVAAASGVSVLGLSSLTNYLPNGSSAILTKVGTNSWMILPLNVDQQESLPLSSNWTNFGDPFQVLTVSRVGRHAWMTGLIRNVNSYNSTITIVDVGGIPAQYRPSKQFISTLNINGNVNVFGRMDVHPNGSVSTLPPGLIGAAAFHVVQADWPLT